MQPTHPSSDQKPLRQLRSLPRNVWVVTLTSFLTDVSSEMLFNLLPLFLANVLGVRTGIIGLIEGIAETTASLVKIYAGWISDRLGRRKWLTVAGYGLSTLAKPFLYFTTTWFGVLAVRFTDRVGKGLRTAPRDALIADSIDEHRRGLAFGLHRAGDTAGAALGLLIALLIVWLSEGNQRALDRAAFQHVVLVSIIPAFLAVLVLALGAKEVGRARNASQRPSLSLRGLGAPFQGYLILIVIFTLGNSSDAFIVLRAQERGLSVIGVLAMLVTFNVVYALVATPAGGLSDRLGRRRFIVVAWSVYALIYLGFALARSVGQIWALFALYGIYYGIAEGTGRAMVADLVPPIRRGAAYGIYNAAVGLAALPASLIAGLLWQGIGRWSGFGPAAPFLFGALLALIAAVGLTRLQLPSPASQS